MDTTEVKTFVDIAAAAANVTVGNISPVGSLGNEWDVELLLPDNQLVMVRVTHSRRSGLIASIPEQTVMGVFCQVLSTKQPPPRPGENITHYEDGRVAIRWGTTTVLHGPYYEWDTYGNMTRAATYHQGVLHGREQTWFGYPNYGKRRSDGYWTLGLRSGAWTFYDEKGRAVESGFYNTGRRIGDWIELDSDGCQQIVSYGQGHGAK